MSRHNKAREVIMNFQRCMFREMVVRSDERVRAHWPIMAGPEVPVEPLEGPTLAPSLLNQRSLVLVPRTPHESGVSC